MKRSFFLTCAIFLITNIQAKANDLPQAPPSFDYLGNKVVPTDFKTQELKILFDVVEKRAIANSLVHFVVGESGRPMFDMRAVPEKVILDGQLLPKEAFQTISAPDNVTKFVMLDKVVSPLVLHRMEIDYNVLPEHITFSENGASVGFFMSDVGTDRDFLEQYAPANLEFDHFSLDVTLKVTGMGSHQLFTNGKLIERARNEWQISFPSYYTSSSFYLHLTQKELAVAQAIYPGLRGPIPLIVYSEKEELTTQGMKKAREVLQELEADYGPFAHEKVVIYVTKGGGGMEYCGATMTSLGALGHELTHSYFARGVMPANGNAGWIDEAIASWRDNDYPTATGGPSRPPVNLGGFSVYRRTTPGEAYEEGAQLMSEFDYLFSERREEGLKPVLQKLFNSQKHEVITTEFFGSFLEGVTAMDLKSLFKKYVYGKTDGVEAHSLEIVPVIPRTKPLPHHPRKYTKSELVNLR